MWQGGTPKGVGSWPCEQPAQSPEGSGPEASVEWSVGRTPAPSTETDRGPVACLTPPRAPPHLPLSNTARSRAGTEPYPPTCTVSSVSQLQE